MKRKPCYMLGLIVAFLAALVIIPTASAKAATITYVDWNGDPVMTAETTPHAIQDDSTATDPLGNLATETAKTEFIDAHGEMIAILEDGDGEYNKINTTKAAAFTDNTELTVVFENDVADGGVDGGVTWFLTEYGTLYIVSDGSVVIESSGAYETSATTKTTEYNGNGFDIGAASIAYGDITGSGWGIKDSYLHDEKDRTTAQYYEYEPNPAEADGLHYQPIADRAPITTEPAITNIVPPRNEATIFYKGKAPWAAYKSNIKSVVFGRGMKLKGNISFLFNDNYETINPGYVEYKTIGESSYPNLEAVTFYCDLTQVTSMAGMFARCPSLKTITHGDAEESTNLAQLACTSFMFYGDEQLVATEGSWLDDMVMPSLTDTSYMFAGCTNLVSDYLNLKDMNMGNVVNANAMFYGCDKARIIFDASSAAKNNVANWDTGNLHLSKYMFSADIPRTSDGKIDFVNNQDDIDPGLGEYNGGYVINGKVDYYKWDRSSIEDVYGMFAKNEGITEAILSGPGYVNMKKLKNATCMFLLCENLRSVVMDELESDELRYTTAMFKAAGRSVTDGSATARFENWQCPKLENTDMMFTASGFSVVNLDGSSDMSTVTDAVAMFSDMPYLSSVGSNAMYHIKFNNVASGEYMFHNDTGISMLRTDLWNMGKVKSVAHMFDGCSSLEYLNVSNWNVSNLLTNMECFAYDTGVQDIDMGHWDTSSVTNMFMAFAKCPDLISFTAPAAAGSLASVTTMNGMFYGDTKLRQAGDFKEAPLLKDARGMFAENRELMSVDLKDLVQGNAVALSYMFRGARALSAIDISGWNTEGVKWFQGMFDSCNTLAYVTSGATNSALHAVDMGAMFRNCHELRSEALNALLKRFSASPELACLYETFNNDYALTSLDMSSMDMSATTDLTRLAAMEEDAGHTTNLLTEIKVPANILTAPGVILTDTSDGNGSSINMFWVDGDGFYDSSHDEDTASDDLQTTFFVNGEIPEKLLSYNFGGSNGDNDNRKFLLYKGRTINGDDTGTYQFTSLTDTALMRADVESTFYKSGTNAETAYNLSPVYAWEKDDNPIPGMENSKTAANSEAGIYKATAIMPMLTGSNAEAAVTFTLTESTDVPRKITAAYKGKSIVVGNKYSKDDVEVIFTDHDGTETKLTPDKFNVNSLNVVAEGSNAYTASYNPGDGELTAPFTVTGVPEGEPYISATYDGDPVKIGENYKKSDVKVTYTTGAGTTTTVSTNGFNVDSTKVTKVGDNEYTVTYKSESGKTLTDKITVRGIEADAYITVKYKGDKVPVGSEYKKDDLEVVYVSGTGEEIPLTSDDFTVDNLKVTKEGDNTFTATYTTEDGKVTATFKVPGFRIIGSIESEYVGPAVLIGEAYNKDNIITTAYYADDKDHTEGFEVTPTGYSTKVIKAAGDNIVTVYYKDEDQGKTLSSQVNINGYKAIASISAEYLGDRIKVGKSYNKANVKVTLYYADGSGATTTKNFTVDSTTVSYVGDNSYVATYKDPYGNSYSAGFTVPGYTSSSSSSRRDRKSSSSSSSTWYPWNPWNSGNGGWWSDYFSPLSTIFNPNGTGTATGLYPVNYGSSTGVVRTGTTGRTVFYIIASLIALSVLCYAIYWKRKYGKKDKDR